MVSRGKCAYRDRLPGGAALTRHGAFSPDGILQFATYGLELLWTLAASFVLVSARTDAACNDVL